MAKHSIGQIKNTIPGIVLDSAGFAFSAETTPAPEHFFPANHFMVKKAGASLHIVFGSRSAFSSSDDLFYNLAVEVDMPLSYASEFLYRAAYFHPTLTGPDHRIIDSLSKIKEGMEKNYGKNNFGLEVAYHIPSDQQRFRRFAANFAAISVSGDQTQLEFFEASPDLIVAIKHGRQGRQNQGVRNIVAIMMDSSLACVFFEKMKTQLADIPGIGDVEGEVNE